MEPSGGRKDLVDFFAAHFAAKGPSCGGVPADPADTAIARQARDGGKMQAQRNPIVRAKTVVDAKK